MGAMGAMYGGMAYLQYVNGKAQGQVAEAQAQVEAKSLESQAEFVEIQAADAVKRGFERELDLRREGKQLIGSQRATLAAQGIQVESGSALEIQEDTAGEVAVNALTIRNNAWRESFGLRNESKQLRTAARQTRAAGRARGRASLISGGLGAIGTGIRGFRAVKGAS